MTARNALLRATELELLTFFEAVPQLDDPSGTWYYGDALYQVARDGMELSFALNPAAHDVRIILKHGENRLYELNADDCFPASRTRCRMSLMGRQRYDFSDRYQAGRGGGFNRSTQHIR